MEQSTFSLALAGITFLLTVIWGAPLIRVLRHWKILETAPVVDSGETFTMGGLLFVLPVLLVTLLLNAADANGLTGVGLSVLLPLGTLILFGALGGWIDIRRVRGRFHRGVLDPYSLTGQLALGILIAYVLRFLLDAPEMFLPFYPGEISVGFWYFPLAVLAVIGSANAYQVTAGVDGLSGMVGATAFATYGAIAVVQEQVFIARFCFSVVGALLGFLWFNIRPAMLTLGRTGTYAMGATLAVVALMTGQWPLLILIAAVPVLEIASVGLQRLAARTRKGRRVFRSTPLHEHYLASGWSRTQIVQRFWLINLLFALIGFTLALV